MKSCPSPVKSSGSGRSSSTFSCASTSVPAATSPTRGTCVVGRRWRAAPDSGSHLTSMARGLLGSRRRRPRRWSVLRWAWTVEVEVRPTASPISRTDGGKPRSCIWLAMNSRIASWRAVGAPSARLSGLLSGRLPGRRSGTRHLSFSNVRRRSRRPRAPDRTCVPYDGNSRAGARQTPVRFRVDGEHTFVIEWRELRTPVRPTFTFYPFMGR